MLEINAFHIWNIKSVCLIFRGMSSNVMSVSGGTITALGDHTHFPRIAHHLKHETNILWFIKICFFCATQKNNKMCS